MSMEVLKMVAGGFAERAVLQGMKGKARDKAALEWMCGAAAALHATGHEAKDQLTFNAFLISVRGYSAIEDVLKEKEKAA